MKLARLIATGIVCCSIFLSGCVTTGVGGKGVGVGPGLSSAINKASRLGKTQNDLQDPNRPRLDVIIPVFDPGLPDDGKEYSEEGVWPELRRAEAVRFAYKMKEALEETGAFGAVRLTPDQTASGDLYVLGKIEESNGEDAEIEMQVVDITGERWLYQSVDHEVEPSFHKNVRNNGKDAYDPLFANAARELVEELSFHDAEKLTEIKRISELRFGASFVEEAFVEHISKDGDRFELASFPSDNDPMLIRTKAIRVRDQLYVDGLQDHYRSFSEGMDTSYLVWQEQSLTEIEARSAARKKAAGEAAVGVALVGLAILAVVAGGNSDSVAGKTAAQTAGVVGGIAGISYLTSSFQTSKETAVHKEALEELGQSIDADLAPKIVAYEQKNVELTGSAKEQFAQWRAFLKKIYMEEQTPEVQL